MSNPRHLSQLRDKLVKHFDEGELRALCMDLSLNYGDLPGRSRPERALELVAFLERSGRIPELVSLCVEKRPKVTWTYQTRIFISYKRHAPIDRRLALFLYEKLTGEKHEVFIDQTMRSGTQWLEEIDQQIKVSDYLLVLLSEQSADSEMVQAEIIRAYKYQRQQRHPAILPVRVAYEEMLPYTIDAFLSQLQYVVWHDENDDERVIQDVLATINGESLQPRPASDEQITLTRLISEDGRAMPDEKTLHAPLPEFDPRLVKSLVAPGGAVKLRDKLYIERQEDQALIREIVHWGTTTTIRAPRQTGKTSLLMRGIRHAKQSGAQVIFLDFQSMGTENLAVADDFLQEFLESACRELRMDPALVGSTWEGPLGAFNKATYFLEDHILPGFEGPIVLAIDEADALLKTDYYKDFFGLLRSWHNRRAKDEAWEKLNIVLVISTEPYLLIDDISQSPFNVGLKLELSDFDQSQVQRLNLQHGKPVPDDQIPELMTLLNGHPYLSRKLLYTMVTDEVDWSKMSRIAATDDGPFSDHLRRNLWKLRNRPELQETLKQVIEGGRSADDRSLFRLLRAGLIKGGGNKYACRCDLYRQYFESKLK